MVLYQYQQPGREEYINELASYTSYQHLKGTMSNMAANLTDNSVTVAAQCVQIVDAICSKFEEYTYKCTEAWCPIV